MKLPSVVIVVVVMPLLLLLLNSTLTFHLALFSYQLTKTPGVFRVGARPPFGIDFYSADRPYNKVSIPVL